MENKIIQALKNELGCSQVNTPFGYSQGILNDSMIFYTNKGAFFVKMNRTNGKKIFESERIGIQKIKETITIRVPTPFYVGEGFFIQEYVELFPHTIESQKKLGEQLAKMHVKEGPGRFGFERDNTIGTTLQMNSWTEDWVEFFGRYRLEVQLTMVETNYSDTEIEHAH